MGSELDDLIERSRNVKMTPDEQEEQRRSFAYANGQIENPRISRESIDREADRMADENGEKDDCSRAT